MNIENHDRKANPSIDNSGFTLLEIIAVLVIMSILAVVAVPKYFDLQEQARQKAMGTGIAEAVGRVNGYFAQEVLANTPPNDIDYTGTEIGTDLGDFYLVVSGPGAGAGGSGDITLTVYGRDDTPVEGLDTETTVPRPGL